MKHGVICVIIVGLLSFSISYGQYFQKETIGLTLYDLQTNGSMQNRFWIHEDGTRAAVWTMGFDYQNQFQSDRGTGYNYFDGTNWMDYPTERIEDGRTGWPSYAPLGINGEIIVTHMAAYGVLDTGLIISTRDQKGEGDWIFSNITGPPGNEDIIWPRMITNGPSNQNVHVLAVTSPSGIPYQGQYSALLYYLSTDAGQSWDIEHYLFPELNSNFYVDIPGDMYNWANPLGDTIAFVIGNKLTDLILMKSFDNGSTWQKTVVWEHPIPFCTSSTITWDSIYCCDGSSSLALDSQGNAHLVFGIDILWYAGGWFWPDPPDGLAYWNETMPSFNGSAYALHPDSLMESGNLVGWSQDINNNGQLDYISYPARYGAAGISNMPSLVCQYDNLYLAYSSITETYDNGIWDFRHIWFRRSTDNGETWGEFYDINGGLIGGFEENVFPSLSVNGDHLGLIFQQDPDPGLAVNGVQHPYIENQIKYVNLDDYVFSPTRVDEIIQVSHFNVFPNPTSKNLFVSGEFYPHDVIKVFDVSGKLHLKHRINRQRNESLLDINNFSSGMFLVKITTKDKVITKKVIIEN